MIRLNLITASFRARASTTIGTALTAALAVVENQENNEHEQTNSAPMINGNNCYGPLKFNGSLTRGSRLLITQVGDSKWTTSHRTHIEQQPVLA
jgi:hypothetical protein